MPATLQVDVYVAPAIPIANGHPDPSKRSFSPISCTLIQGPTSAVLVDTPTTIDLTQDLARWVKKTAPGKKLQFIYTTHAHGDHFLGNPVLLQQFPDAQCVATPAVVNDIEKQWSESLAMWTKMFPGGQIAAGQVIPKPLPTNGDFAIDGYSMRGIDVSHSDTEASSFLHVPDLKLVVCGDIVYGDCYQFFGEANTQEKRKKWLDALDQIAALEPDIVVPGHKRESQANGPYLIDATKEYIYVFEEELSKAKDAEALENAMVSRYPQRLNRFLLEWSCKSSFEEYSRARGSTLAVNNIDLADAFYSHPKILVTALNGPVIGLTAALIAHSDLIFATPETYLLTPFSSLGIVTEGGSSIAFARRMGLSKAKEALLFSRRISIEELKQTGFVNRVLDTPGEHQFKRRVLEAVHSYLGDHLNDSSVLEIKKLLREPSDREFNTQAVKEFFGGLRRFAEGIPQAEFQKIASGAKKHKL